jgi:protein-serine/threonine kinase
MTDTKSPPSTRPHPSNLHISKTNEHASNESQNHATWDDDRFLLTPPLPTSTVNPLEQALFRNSNEKAFLANANQQAFLQNAQLNTSSPPSLQVQQDAAHMMSGLHIKTDMHAPKRTDSTQSFDSDSKLRSSASAASLPRRAPSVRSLLHSSAGSVSPGGYISSPQIAAMLDITPLPSPTMQASEWRALSLARSRSRTSSLGSVKEQLPPTLVGSTPSSPRKKAYGDLKSPKSRPGSKDGHLSADHSRTRSISDYVPDPLAVPKPRNIAVSSSGAPLETTESPTALQREEYIGPQRVGLKTPTRPVTPPEKLIERTHEDEPAAKRPKLEIFTARSLTSNQSRSYEAIKPLGQGTFSKVYLAVRQVEQHQKDSVD